MRQPAAHEIGNPLAAVPLGSTSPLTPQLPVVTLARLADERHAGQVTDRNRLMPGSNNAVFRW